MERGSCLKTAHYFPTFYQSLPLTLNKISLPSPFEASSIRGFFCTRKKEASRLDFPQSESYLFAHNVSGLHPFLFIFSVVTSLFWLGGNRGGASPAYLLFSRFGHGAELADINSRPPSLPPSAAAASSFIFFLFLFICQIRQCCIYKLSV